MCLELLSQLGAPGTRCLILFIYFIAHQIIFFLALSLRITYIVYIEGRKE